MIELRRVKSERDIDAFLAVRTAIDPDHPIPRPAYEQHVVEPGRIDLLALVDGKAVGAAFVEPKGKLEGATGYVSVRVLREHRGRGIGTALFRAVSEQSRAAGWSELYSVARHDDADTLTYLPKRGFVEVLRMQELSLDLATAAPDLELPRGGVEIAALSPELEPAVYEAARDIHPDIPGDDGWIGDIGEWRRQELPAHTIRACTFAALDGGEVVAYATLHDAGEGIGMHGMTGVLPAWRGRGVAVALKSAQIVAARSAGLVELRTTTAVQNAPMLHVNERLGYRRGVAWIHLCGPLLDGQAP